MEIMAFSIENYLDSNNKVLDKNNPLKTESFASKLETSKTRIEDKSNLKERRDFKSNLDRASWEKGAENKEIKTDESFESEDEVEEKVSNEEEHPIFFMNYILNVNDNEIPKDSNYSDSDDISLNIIEKDSLESIVEDIITSDGEGVEPNRLEVLSEKNSIEEETLPKSQVVKEEDPIRSNNEVFNSKGIIEKNNSMEIGEEETFKEDFPIAKQLETDVGEKEVSQDDYSKDIKNNKELVDEEVDKEMGKEMSKESKTEINDKTFTIMDKKEIMFTGKANLDLENNHTVKAKDIVQQIVEKFKVDLSQSKNEITVQLKPEVLGKMTMSIELVKDSIVAKIMVDNQKTKEVIEGNLIQLKEGIKDTGLEIKTFEVFVGNNSDFDKHESSQFNFNQNNKRVKLKAQSHRKRLSYEEAIDNSGMNKVDPYLDNNLNLLA